MYRHLNERSKQWESKDHNSKVSMSMCRHLMHDQMDRNEGRRVFEEHRVTLKQLTSLKTPESKFTHHQALFRVQGRYYTWETAGEFFFLSAFPFFSFLLSSGVHTLLVTMVVTHFLYVAFFSCSSLFLPFSFQ